MPWPNLTIKEAQFKNYLAAIPIRITIFQKTGRCITFQFTSFDEAEKLSLQLMREYHIGPNRLRVDKDKHRLHITASAFNSVASKLGLEASELQNPPTIRFMELKKVNSDIERRTNEIIEYLKTHGKNFYEVLKLFNLASEEGDNFREWYAGNKKLYNIDLGLTSPKLVTARAATRLTFFLNEQLEKLTVPNTDFFYQNYAPQAPQANANLLSICLSELYCIEENRLANIRELFKNNPEFLKAFSQEIVVTFGEMYEDYLESVQYKKTSESEVSTLSCPLEEQISTLEIDESPSHSQISQRTPKAVEWQQEEDDKSPAHSYNLRKKKRTIELPREEGRGEERKEEDAEYSLPNKKYKKR